MKAASSGGHDLVGKFSFAEERFPITPGVLAMAQPIMVACDLHDRTMLLKVAQGRRAPETISVRNTRSERERMIVELQRRGRVGRAKVIFAYEASGQGFGLHDELTQAGITCYVLAPSRMTRSADAKRTKTDEKDAEMILEILRGHVLAGNSLPKVWIPDAQTRDDRELVRARTDVAEKLAALKSQIKGLLKRLHLARPEGLGQGWTKGFWGWLRCLLDDSALGLGSRQTLAGLMRQLEFLEQEIARLEQALIRLAESPRYAAAVQRLIQLQGVGPLTALVFLTEIGNLKRFGNRRQISAYLGLVPRSHESGTQTDRKGHITRQGPSRVRRVLCQATWARVRHEGAAQQAYQRLVEKNPKRKKIAVVAGMRRLAVLMWHRACEVLDEASPHGAVRLATGCAPAG
jgi:transposase